MTSHSLQRPAVLLGFSCLLHAAGHALAAEAATTQPHTRPATRLATQPDGPVAHVVLIWLKKPGDPAGRQALIDGSRQLGSIPGVLDVRAGVPLPSTRPVVDSTYDVGVYMLFRDRQALLDYATDPTHVRLVREVLQPNAERYKAYDFTISP